MEYYEVDQVQDITIHHHRYILIDDSFEIDKVDYLIIGKLLDDA